MIRTAFLLLAVATLAHAGTFPIVEVGQGFLLGAVSDGKWLPLEKEQHLVKGGEQYRVYSLTGALGTVRGAKPHPTEEPCPEQETVALKPKPQKGAIAFAGTWNALPRVPKMQETTQPVYQKAVADYLVDKGIRNPKVRTKQIVRVDLDGDGEDEVLVSATNYFTKDHTVPSDAPAGSYSCVLLRRVVAGKVTTQLIEGEFYPKAGGFAAPKAFKIAPVLDLVGERKMEVIIESGYYEGGEIAVYRVTGKKPEQSLQIGCGA